MKKLLASLSALLPLAAGMLARTFTIGSRQPGEAPEVAIDVDVDATAQRAGHLDVVPVTPRAGSRGHRTSTR